MSSIGSISKGRSVASEEAETRLAVGRVPDKRQSHARCDGLPQSLLILSRRAPSDMRSDMPGDMHACAPRAGYRSSIGPSDKPISDPQ